MKKSYRHPGNDDSAQAMHRADQLANRIHKVGLKVMSAHEIEYGHQIRLECGAIVNLFTSGSVTVQGKLDPRTKVATVYLLQQILPSHAVFPPSMVPKVKTKSMTSVPDGFVDDHEPRWFAPTARPSIESSPSHSTPTLTTKALPNLVVDELGEYVPEELRQVREDTGEPYERW